MLNFRYEPSANSYIYDKCNVNVSVMLICSIKAEEKIGGTHCTTLCMYGQICPAWMTSQQIDLH